MSFSCIVGQSLSASLVIGISVLQSGATRTLSIKLDSEAIVKPYNWMVRTIDTGNIASVAVENDFGVEAIRSFSWRNTNTLSIFGSS